MFCIKKKQEYYIYSNNFYVVSVCTMNPAEIGFPSNKYCMEYIVYKFHRAGYLA